MRTNPFPAKMKKALLIGLVAILVLAISAITAGIIIFDRQGWGSSRELSAALKGARAVTLVEFVPGRVIARRAATPDEMSRLQDAASVWPYPFVFNPYLCYQPHHRLEIVRADGSDVHVNFCFLCKKVSLSDDEYGVELPPSLGKSMDSFFTSVGMTPKTYEEYRDLENEASERDAQAEEQRKQPE